MRRCRERCLHHPGDQQQGGPARPSTSATLTLSPSTTMPARIRCLPAKSSPARPDRAPARHSRQVRGQEPQQDRDRHGGQRRQHCVDGQGGPTAPAQAIRPGNSTRSGLGAG